MIRSILWCLAIVALLGAGGTLGTRWLDRQLRAPGPNAEPVVVSLPKGAGLADIAGLLADAGAIRDPLVFEVGVRVAGKAGRLKAGEYEIPPGSSASEVMAILVMGGTRVYKLTVPEGLTSAEVVRLVAAAPVLAGEAGPVPAEGTLLPETYHYSRGDDRADLVRRMTGDMTATLERLWAERDPDLPLDRPEQALILASIVEKETGLAAERPFIAGVFYNRLKAGMPLQSDPTVAYALAGPAGVLDRALTRADLDTASPYNTYLHKGLPPGPIANPGRAALDAVLHPEATDALYFVADGDGGHAFASTLEEHNRNVARWRRLQDD